MSQPILEKKKDKTKGDFRFFSNAALSTSVKQRCY